MIYVALGIVVFSLALLVIGNRNANASLRRRQIAKQPSGGSGFLSSLRDWWLGLR